MYKAAGLFKLPDFFCKIFENSARKICRSRKTLKNEYLVGKIGVDAAENGPRKESCVVAGVRTLAVFTMKACEH